MSLLCKVASVALPNLSCNTSWIEFVEGSRRPLTWPWGLNPAYLRKEVYKVRDKVTRLSKP
jgi:hypothetical protein